MQGIPTDAETNPLGLLVRQLRVCRTIQPRTAAVSPLEVLASARIPRR